MVYAPGTLTLMIVILLKDRDWGLIIYLDPEWRGLAALAYTVWMSLHCQFTAHYLQTACLFRKTFLAQNEEDFNKIKRRKRCLQIGELSLYASFSAVVIYLIVAGNNRGRETWDYVWFFFSNLVIIAIPLVGIFSARHINNNSRSVERLGIRTNSKIMKLYLGFWMSVSVDCIVVGILMIILTEEHELRRGAGDE